ncbi:MAG: exodeoxyribonuclease VII small subunit [Candidatus Schekmanbacteria bacterium]|nr:exodeoxyribonuclease VII small subunit [Candidatus Schekmanbacteria bacterium]
MPESDTHPGAAEREAPTPSFEAQLGRIEEIVRSLESGDLPLEESIRRFEEGVTLLRSCRSVLDNAEQKVEKLVALAEGVEPGEPGTAFGYQRVPFPGRAVDANG